MTLHEILAREFGNILLRSCQLESQVLTLQQQRIELEQQLAKANAALKLEEAKNRKDKPAQPLDEKEKK